MRLPQARKEVIGINSIQEKAETTLVNLLQGPKTISLLVAVYMFHRYIRQTDCLPRYRANSYLGTTLR